MNLCARLTLSLLLFGIVACNSRFEPPKSVTSKTFEVDGILVNNHGKKLTHLSLPVSIYMDNSVPSMLRESCTRAAEQINDLTNLSLLQITDDESEAVTTIKFGDTRSAKPSHQAHTDIEYLGRVISKATVVFDSRYTYSQAPTSDEYDAQSVCLHELGHVLALAHSDDEDSIMFYGLKNAEVRQTLSAADIAKMVTHYGR